MSTATPVPFEFMPRNFTNGYIGAASAPRAKTITCPATEPALVLVNAGGSARSLDRRQSRFADITVQNTVFAVGVSTGDVGDDEDPTGSYGNRVWQGMWTIRKRTVLWLLQPRSGVDGQIREIVRNSITKVPKTKAKDFTISRHSTFFLADDIFQPRSHSMKVLFQCERYILGGARLNGAKRHETGVRKAVRVCLCECVAIVARCRVAIAS